MTSITYNDIFSRFYTKVSAYDFLSLTEEQLNNSLCNWLHSAAKAIYIRKLFSAFILDDEIQTVMYEMNYAINEDFDNEFVIEILSDGIIMEWLSPKINNILLISQMFGSKEEKYFSQSAHLKEIRDLYGSIRHKLMQEIADRGYSWNKYLDGE